MKAYCFCLINNAYMLHCYVYSKILLCYFLCCSGKTSRQCLLVVLGWRCKFSRCRKVPMPFYTILTLLSESSGKTSRMAYWLVTLVVIGADVSRLFGLCQSSMMLNLISGCPCVWFLLLFTKYTSWFKNVYGL